MNIVFSKKSVPVPFKELISFVIGGEWGKAPSYEDSEYSLAYCIRGSEFRNWDEDRGKTASLRKIKNSKLQKRKLQNGDILVEISGGGPDQPVGRTVLIDKTVFSFENEIPKVCTNFLRLVRPNPIIISKYLNFYLNLFYSSGEVVKYQAGSNNLRNLKFNDYSQIKIPLIPLPEQRAIVSKIELLFSELDNGIANLKLAQEQLKVYRQAVLKKAFEGKLTQQWREQQNKLPDSDELLEQIYREGEEYYNKKLEEWKKTVKEWEYTGKEGKKPTKPRKSKEIESLNKDELSELSRLPSGWSWVKLGQIIVSAKDGPHYSPKYQENGIPFISGGNIRSSGIDFSNTKYISRELHEELSKRCKPELNDILYTKGGTTGIARVNTYDIDFNVWVHVAVLKPVESIYPFYLQHALNSWHCYRQSQTYTHGVGNQDLGLTRMVLITLPFCSIEEQQAIATEIETRLSVCDKVEQDITENLERAEALRQSILKKAFEGKLLSEKELEEVRTAPGWEPAELLLERVKAGKK